MPRARGIAAQTSPILFARVDPPGLISMNEDESGEPDGLNNPPDQGGDRTLQWPLAPDRMEARVMLADRVNEVFNPGSSYANQDPQKGGAPGSPGGDPSHPNAGDSFITSQSPSGVDSKGGAPTSQLKLTYGASDWMGPTPTFLPAHLKIAIRQNPNAAQNNVGIWAAEGPMANTQYTSPAPWAAGSYIG